MILPLKNTLGLLKMAGREWSRHGATQLGAALAFYTIFAIAPLFLIVLAIAGMWFGEEAARRQLFDQLNGLVGAKGGEAIQAIVAAADKPKAGTWASVIAVSTLFVGATGVFVHLQAALNTVWEVPRETGKGLWRFVKDRLLSFAMVIAIGFLLLVSLVVSAVLTAVGKYISGYLPGEEVILHLVNFVVSLGVISVLFALIFKILPDVKIAWADVWLGACITAFLFNLGKSLLSLYVGRGSFASAYGAAGSLVIILVWVYYSAQILFFGAEFTRLHAGQQKSKPTSSRTINGKRAGRARPDRAPVEGAAKI